MRTRTAATGKKMDPKGCKGRAALRPHHLLAVRMPCGDRWRLTYYPTNFWSHEGGSSFSRGAPTCGFPCGHPKHVVSKFGAPYMLLSQNGCTTLFPKIIASRNVGHKCFSKKVSCFPTKIPPNIASQNVFPKMACQYGFPKCCLNLIPKLVPKMSAPKCRPKIMSCISQVLLPKT